MDHESVKTLFSDLLEGELPPEQQAEVQEHLRGCAACRAELEAFRATLRSLSGLHSLPPPPRFVSQVQQRIYRRSRGRFFRRQRLITQIPFEWISFVIIILLLVMYMFVLQGQVREVKPPTGVPGPERPALKLEKAKPGQAPAEEQD